MADIKKCDICGRIYQGGAHHFISGTYSSRVTVSDYGDYTSAENHTYDGFDTCPTCTTRVRNFITAIRVEAAVGITPVKPEQPCKCKRRRKCRKE